MGEPLPEPTKIEEVTEGTEVYKVRYDFDDRTAYDVHNKSSGKAEVNITFVKCDNIRIEMGEFVQQPVPKELNFTLDLPAGATRTLVVLYTQDEDKPWAFDYDLKAAKSEDPAWLD